MSIIANNLLQGDEGYNLSKSLRFRSSASAYLNRTFGIPTNATTWSFSTWMKRGKLGVGQTVIGASVAQFDGLYFNPSDQLVWYVNGSATITTTAVFRDPSAWYHIVLKTSGTSSVLYVNNVQVGTGSVASVIFNTAISHIIGQNSSSNYLDGYLTEINFIDGQALTPSSFGSTNALTGVWQPARYTGTYGTNGFYLPFTDNSALTTSSNVGLGRDFSGNGNYWTTNNISITAGTTYDSMTDVPTLTSATTANYCVLTPLAPVTGSVLSNGNLTTTYASSSAGQNSYGTIEIPTTGKWYWEVISSSMPANQVIGIWSSANYNTNTDAGCLGYISNGQKSNAGTNTSYGASFTTGDVIGVAFDAGAGTLTFYKNNTSQGTAFSSITGSYFAGMRHTNNSGTSTVNFNFGQRPFSYTPPTGFVALNTFNLPEPSIKAGNKQMDATTYTGNNTTNIITNSGSMQPDFVWIKSRSTAANHALMDVIRGVSWQLQSSTTNAESQNSAGKGLQSFNSNGFTLGQESDAVGGTNANGASYVGWQWKANGAAVTNTAGSISSQVSANTTAGFSVVTYTGNGTSGATVGHGLGVAPSMIIPKVRSRSGDNWHCYHSALGGTQGILLNTTNAASTDSGFWNNTNPSSSVFTVGTYNTFNTQTYVAYCWSEVAGYSKFGSYTGNGSADGTFVYLGFRPKYVVWKKSNVSGGHWGCIDGARNPYNLANLSQLLNAADADATNVQTLDLLSNGFKVRTSDAGQNSNGDTFIYMAFAENPTKYALGR